MTRVVLKVLEVPKVLGVPVPKVPKVLGVPVPKVPKVRGCRCWRCGPALSEAQERRVEGC